MQKFIILDQSNKIVNVRYAEQIVFGEIESEFGELGQIMQADGTFIDDSEPQHQQAPSIEERISAIEDALLMIL